VPHDPRVSDTPHRPVASARIPCVTDVVVGVAFAGNRGEFVAGAIFTAVFKHRRVPLFCKRRGTGVDDFSGKLPQYPPLDSRRTKTLQANVP